MAINYRMHRKYKNNQMVVAVLHLNATIIKST